MTRRGWIRDELLMAFNLYCKTAFGRLHRNNPDIINLASLVGRTPSTVAMKLTNFASLDPAHQRRNVRGLRDPSQSDRGIFEEFSSNWEQLAFESEQALQRISASSAEPPPPSAEIAIPEGPTDRQQMTRVRTVQRFFRGCACFLRESLCDVWNLSGGTTQREPHHPVEQQSCSSSRSNERDCLV